MELGFDCCCCTVWSADFSTREDGEYPAAQIQLQPVANGAMQTVSVQNGLLELTVSGSKLWLPGLSANVAIGQTYGAFVIELDDLPPDATLGIPGGGSYGGTYTGNYTGGMTYNLGVGAVLPRKFKLMLTYGKWANQDPHNIGLVGWGYAAINRPDDPEDYWYVISELYTGTSYGLPPSPWYIAAYVPDGETIKIRKIEAIKYDCAPTVYGRPGPIASNDTYFNGVCLGGVGADLGYYLRVEGLAGPLNVVNDTYFLDCGNVGVNPNHTAGGGMNCWYLELEEPVFEITSLWFSPYRYQYDGSAGAGRVYLNSTRTDGGVLYPIGLSFKPPDTNGFMAHCRQFDNHELDCIGDWSYCIQYAQAYYGPTDDDRFRAWEDMKNSKVFITSSPLWK